MTEEHKEFIWDSKKQQWCHHSVLKKRQKERSKKKPAKDPKEEK